MPSAAGLQPALLRGHRRRAVWSATRRSCARRAGAARHGRAVTPARRGPPARRAAGGVRARPRTLRSTSSPTRRAYLLRERLGVRLAEAAQPVERREPFVPGRAGRLRACAPSCSPGAPSWASDARLLQELRARGPAAARAAWARSSSAARRRWWRSSPSALAAATTGEPLETIRFGRSTLGRVASRRRAARRRRATA